MENVENVENVENNDNGENVEKIKVQEYDKVNSAVSIWTKNPKDVTEEEYKQFYKEFSNDWQDYAFMKHFNVEGKYEFTALIYIPTKSAI